MRQLLTCGLMLLAAGTLFAQQTPTRTARQRTPAVADELREMRAQIAAQQQQIQELQKQLQQLQQSPQFQPLQVQSTTGVVVKNAAYTPREDQTATSSVTASPQAGGEQKRVPALDEALRRVRWTGDVRVRQEDFFLAGQNPRLRERIRVRLNVESDLGQDFVGGFSFATGNLADPTSTNETLTNFFEKKVIGFDRGFVTYHPQAHKWLSLTGGKFAFTWVRTGQTFDSDLNPEGFSEKLSFDLKHSKLKNFTVTAMQLLFNENSNTRFGVSGSDSFAAGAQVSGKVALGKRWTLSPAYTLLNWRNEGILLNAPSNGNGQTPGAGTSNIVCTPVSALGTAPSCTFAVSPFAPNGLTNSYRVTALASNGNLTRAFLGQFLYSDLILDNTIDTGKAKWPWRVLLEYENNLRAPSPATGRSPASHAYLVETSIGQAKNKGDLQIGYAWLRQEKDSVLASFVESDQRTPTNVLQHRFYANYKLHPKVTAAYTLWVGRVLDTSLFAPVTFASGGVSRTDALQAGFLAPGVTPGAPDRYLKRMQFDLMYSF